MAGFTTVDTSNLIRSDVWSKDIKRVLQEELMGTKYVRWLDFPDGTTLHIPSLGTFQHRDYAEGQQVIYDAADTGDFTFTVNKYKSSATYITNKMKQDSFYMSELMATFVPGQARALAEVMEADMLRVGPETQTASALNNINGQPHRFIGTGTNETLSVLDFAKAGLVLDMANVPTVNRIAIIDPTAAYALQTQTNLVNFTNNPSWQGVVKTGLLSGTRFMTTVFGFDVYVSRWLKKNTTTETINGVTAALGVHNLFFSAASDVLPIVGAVRQSPKVDSEYNKDWQREEYVTTCRYDFALFRPENLVDIITDMDQT